MKTRKLLLMAPAILTGVLFFMLTSFTPKEIGKRPCEVTCQFSPTTSDFQAASIDNCNSWASSSPVVANTNFTPILSGIGCTTLNITVFFPSVHPAGTLTIWKNGSVIATYPVGANQQIGFDLGYSAACDDYFQVTW